MKLYLFFKNVEGLAPTMYAFTNDKKLYKEFKEERNMKIFVETIQEVTKEEFHEFENKYKGYQLGRRGYITKPSSSNPLKYKTYVYIVSTYDEEMQTYIKSDEVSNLLMKYTDTISMYFNDELLEALETLGYFKILKMNYGPLPFLDGVSNGEELLTFGGLFPDCDPDMLSIFITLFGYTMNKE